MLTFKKKVAITLGVAAAVAAPVIITSGGSAGAAYIRTTVQIPARIHSETSEFTCDGKGSPSLTLGGTAMTGAIGTTVKFMNNTKGTKQNQAIGDTQLFASLPEATAPLPKGVGKGGAGGNPWIILELEVGGVSSYVTLGRCKQGIMESVDQDLLIPAVAEIFMTGVSCDNRGSTIDLFTHVDAADITTRLWFDNNNDLDRGPTPRDRGAELGMEWTGDPITGLAKGWRATSGFGGNPLIYWDIDGDATGMALLGRCNKI